MKSTFIRQCETLVGTSFPALLLANALLILGFSGCVSPEEEQEAPSRPGPKVEDFDVAAAVEPELPPPEAQVVTRDLIVRYPHLVGHLNGILLANEDTHVIIAEAWRAKADWRTSDFGLDDPERSWQPLIAAVYLLDDQGHWNRSRSASHLFVKTSDSAIALRRSTDQSIDPGTNSIKIKFSGSTAADHLEMQLSLSKSRHLQIKMTGNRSTTLPPFKFRGFAGQSLTAESEEIGGIRGSMFGFRFNGPDITSLVSSRPFQVKSNVSEFALFPEEDLSDTTRPHAEQLDLYFGLNSTRAPLEATIRKECYYQESRKLRLSLEDCIRELDSTTLKISTGAADLGLPGVPVAVSILDERKRELIPVYLTSQKTIDVELPAGRDLFLLDRSKYQKTEPIAFRTGVGQELELTLATRKLSRVSIDAGSDAGPALLVINRVGQHKGESGIVKVDGSSSFRPLESNSNLVWKWPFSATMVEGEYEAQLLTGLGGTFCTIRMRVRDGRPDHYRCPRALAGTIENKVEVNWLGADLAATGTMASLRHGELLGVHWLADSTGTQTTQNRSNTKFGIPVQVHDGPPYEIGIRAIGVGANSKAEYRKFLQEQSPTGLIDKEVSAQDRARQFVEWIRKTYPSAFVELGCPPLERDLRWYSEQLEAFDPDGLRMFGCRAGEEQELLLSWLGSLHRVDRRFLITSVNGYEQAENGLFFNRLMFIGREDQLTSDTASLMQAMLRGAYTLSAGAIVTVQSIVPSTRSGSSQTLEMTMQLSVRDDVLARLLIVYSEHGEIARHIIYDTNQAQQKIPLTIDVPGGTKWVRVEIRGGSRRASASQLFERGEGLHLGTTNFVSIDKAILNRGQDPGGSDSSQR